ARDCGTHWCGGPDFCVEIASPGDRSRDKLAFYAGIGVRELLLVDRDPWALELFRLSAGRLEPVGRSDLSKQDALPSPVVPVSHFREHMMFKRSDKYTWEDVNRIFDEMGARYNAFTSQEMTAYYANVLPEFTEKAVEHLSHLLRPALRESDFTTEKNVILEEIAMYLDDPGHRLYEKLMETHF